MQSKYTSDTLQCIQYKSNKYNEGWEHGIERTEVVGWG